MQRKEDFENGYEEKWPKPKGSENIYIYIYILREMSEGRLRSLGK